ncbi:TIGR00341 family protein [Natronoarchaeum philippinense]|uniref:TIGR00341 family protein n=1 Tax=Natronoarchaeum philippinense TaxID=558529 RepID=A0A285N8C3_NATPI|nr:TIGR00341 family protein [Natronoarchaeum philippinense]SNZ05715.1 TIGR00341 family protein [Natronoarchaeum philippinense]
MRLIQVLIPEGSRQPVLDVLEGQGIDYAVFEETGRGEFEAMVQFPVPPTGVEPVLEDIRAAGISESAYTIVLPTETVVSERLDALKALYPGDRLSREELKASAQSLAPELATYFAFIVLSTVIATGGLLLDSAATIIGAMVVAPLMGPAITASAGSVLADRDLTARGIALQVAGLVLAIVVAAAVGAVLKGTVIIPPGTDIRTIPQVAERTSPGFLSLFIAFGSGIAGAISVSRGSGSTLVGVAIAVALIPPAATSGLGIAWGYSGVAASAAVLVLVNLLSINLSALAIFWLSGYRPELSEQRDSVRASVLKRGAVLVVALVGLSIILGATTFAAYQTTTFENQATAETEQFFDDPAFSEYQLEAIEVDYDSQDIILGNDPTVSVVVGQPNAADVPPDIAERLERQIEQRTGQDAGVRVGVIIGQESEPIPPTVDATTSARIERPHPNGAAAPDFKRNENSGRSITLRSSVPP